MPELPDVATMQQYVHDDALNRKIKAVDVRDAKVLKNISAKKLSSELTNRYFRSSQRHGKYLLIRLDNDKYLIIHFGMTGFLKYCDKEEELPDHTRVVFAFSNGHRLAYDCQRKLGLVTITDDADAFADKKDLGPDALDDVSCDKFKELLSNRRGSIKSALLNQSILSGIGNVYGDEILFQSGVHPSKPASELNEKTLKKIYNTMRRVLKTAANREADVDKMPDSYLLPHRDGDGKCPRCSSKIEQTKVSGRTTYFCPQCQS